VVMGVVVNRLVVVNRGVVNRDVVSRAVGHGVCYVSGRIKSRTAREGARKTLV
jgi:hypothetical protein